MTSIFNRLLIGSELKYWPLIGKELLMASDWLRAQILCSHWSKESGAFCSRGWDGMGTQCICCSTGQAAGSEAFYCSKQGQLKFSTIKRFIIPKERLI